MRFGKYELTDEGHDMGGEHYRVVFPNGFGASIIKFGGSYGYPRNYELAVLKGKTVEDAVLTYDTPITDNVIGYLSPNKVGEKLEQIEALSPFDHK